MSQTTSLAALVVIGSKASDGSGLFAGDAADLGHAHQNGDRGSQADTVDAGDQVEPSREITMLANGGDQSEAAGAVMNFFLSFAEGILRRRSRRH
jgi:hypothetical protein